MNNQIILKKITSLSFRQVIYVTIGLILLVNGIVGKDWTTGILSLLFLYQGIFNACLFGSCAVPRRR
ncbi:hypothetical protein ABIB50_002716 [Mucilaginibacter sp. UYCu711]